MTPGPLDPRRLEEFAGRVSAHPRRRMDSAAIWGAFAAAFPARPVGSEERVWLRAALENLESRGILRLPSLRGPRWDRTIGVSLPLSVDVVSEPNAPRARQWRTFPWHPRLQWVADVVSLSQQAEGFLRRVHEGMVSGRFAEKAPLKYRSLQLTGDEKALAELAKTRLFGPGRLDFELLGCIDDAPPLAWQRVSGEPSLIVFENTGAFAVARRIMASVPHPPYGLVACGEGARFQRSMVQLKDIPGPLERIDYAGDLDHEGLQLAVAANRAAIAAGLPEIRPAESLHRAMLVSAKQFGHPLGWPSRSSSRRPEWDAVQFVSPELRALVRAVLESGRRIPEEVLGPDELAAAWAL